MEDTGWWCVGRPGSDLWHDPCRCWPGPQCPTQPQDFPPAPSCHTGWEEQLHHLYLLWSCRCETTDMKWKDMVVRACETREQDVEELIPLIQSAEEYNEYSSSPVPAWLHSSLPCQRWPGTSCYLEMLSWWSWRSSTCQPQPDPPTAPVLDELFWCLSDSSGWPSSTAAFS